MAEQRLLPELDRPTTSTATCRPLWQHVVLSSCRSASASRSPSRLALVAHRRRWLVGPITQVTGILYTIPSLALFFLLLPITGRGNTTALIALTPTRC